VKLDSAITVTRSCYGIYSRHRLWVNQREQNSEISFSNAGKLGFRLKRIYGMLLVEYVFPMKQHVFNPKTHYRIFLI
jgi:hypothetical protein